MSSFLTSVQKILWYSISLRSVIQHQNPLIRNQIRIITLIDCQKIVSIQIFDTWLILPVVICLSQRLSHACLRSLGTRKGLSVICERLIITVTNLATSLSYKDNTANCSDNTCSKASELNSWWAIALKERMLFTSKEVLTAAMWPRGSISSLSVSCFSKGETRHLRVRGISVRFRRGSLRNGYYI